MSVIKLLPCMTQLIWLQFQLHFFFLQHATVTPTCMPGTHSPVALGAAKL